MANLQCFRYLWGSVKVSIGIFFIAIIGFAFCRKNFELKPLPCL